MLSCFKEKRHLVTSYSRFFRCGWRYNMLLAKNPSTFKLVQNQKVTLNRTWAGLFLRNGNREEGRKAGWTLEEGGEWGGGEAGMAKEGTGLQEEGKGVAGRKGLTGREEERGGERQVWNKKIKQCWKKKFKWFHFFIRNWIFWKIITPPCLLSVELIIEGSRKFIGHVVLKCDISDTSEETKQIDWKDNYHTF